jgi:chromosome segregation ATPase
MSKTDLKGNQKKSRLKANQKAKTLRGQIKALGTKKANAPEVAKLKAELRLLQLGKITRKHLAVRKVNELFGLNFNLDKNDIADSILLGMAYLKGAPICDGLRPKQKKELPA